MGLIYVALGGALGSVLRYLASGWLGRLDAGGFPLPVFLVNVTGSFLMGLWIGHAADDVEQARNLHLLLAVGVLGGYTTFSTFSLESYALLQKGSYATAAAYIGGSVLLSIAALFGGLMLARAVAS